jgi:hypothetical protein
MTPQTDPEIAIMRRRTVSFDEKEDIIRGVPDSWDYSSAEARKIWYQPSDYMLFKTTARLIAREARDQGMDSSLNHTYDCSDDALVQGRLNRWCRHGTCSRGLERWIHEASAKQRKVDAVHRTRMVLETQDKLKGQVSAEYLTLEIATVSESCTSKHRRHALLMGRADDHAVHATMAVRQGTVDRNTLQTNETKEGAEQKMVGREPTIQAIYMSRGIHFIAPKMQRYKIRNKFVVPAC